MTAAGFPAAAAPAGRRAETVAGARRTLALPFASPLAAADSASRDTVVMGPEPEPAPPETSASDAESGDAGPAAPAAPRRSRFDKPRWVMLRSAVLPGWGQVHNGSWIKAAAVAAGEVGMLWRLSEDRQLLARLERDVEAARNLGDDDLEGQLVDQYNAKLDAYTGRQWLLGAVFVYSLLDAYIDAHFRGFKTEFQRDPALPEGVPPVSEMRFGLRFSF